MIQEETNRRRQEYETAGIDVGDMAADPFTQFEDWYAGVVDAGLQEPNAFVLATADPYGAPSARAVLMKEFSTDGLVFYTGMSSRKSRELAHNPQAAATFVWIPLHRQVRFEGAVTAVGGSEADAYFATRPRGAQIAAHASRQSEIVAGREVLDDRFRELDAAFGDEVSRPPDWGGWRLAPATVEFWQGRLNRFHDRILYRREGQAWVKERLAP